MGSGKTLQLVIAAAILFAGAVDGGKLPPEIPVCKRRDPKVNECLKKALELSGPTFKKGIPSLGVLPLDPLNITELNIIDGGGPVTVNLLFKDIQLTGISKFVTTGVQFNPETYNLFIESKSDDNLIIAGKYNIKGKILVLPVTGEGHCNITAGKIEATSNITMEKFAVDGKEYLRIKKYDFRYTARSLWSHFEGLFGQDKELADNMNKFLNDNWKEILDEMKPATEEAYSETFRQIGNTFFTSVPLNEIFLE